MTDMHQHSSFNCAKLAGFLYLLIIVFGISSEMLIRSTLVDVGDGSATAENILNSIGLYRVGFFLDSLMLLCDVAIALLFYFLFRHVSQPLAVAAATFRLIQAAILSANLLNYYAVLLVLNGGYAGAFNENQLSVLVSLFLDMHSHGYDLGLLFFGVSNGFLGYLIMRSGFMPRVLGIGLLAAAVVYLTGSYIRFLLPDLTSLFEVFYIIPLATELSVCLWLMVKGS